MTIRSADFVIVFTLVVFPHLLFGRSFTVASTNDASSVVAWVDNVEIKGASSLQLREQELLATHLRGDSIHTDWIERLQQKAIQMLTGMGYLDAQVTSDVQPTPGNNHWRVVLTIKEGPQYTVSKIWWSGASDVSLQELKNVSAVHEGDILSRAALSKTSSALRRFFADRGFPAATVDMQFRELPSSHVDLYFDITQGARGSDIAPLKCKALNPEEVSKLSFVRPPADDTGRDAQIDLALAQLEAKRTGRKVMVIVGGNWCPPCVALDRIFEKNKLLMEMRDNKFVVLHIDAQAGTSQCMLKNDLPLISAFPTIVVIDPDHSNSALTYDPMEWQSLDGFDPGLIKAFLDQF